MEFLEKILKSSWLDYQRKGDQLCDVGELGLALEAYQSARTRFDGSSEDRKRLSDRISRVQSQLRTIHLDRAREHTLDGKIEEALNCLETAFDLSTTEEEQNVVELAYERLLCSEKTLIEALGERKQPTIHYLVTGKHSYTMRNFLDSWGHQLSGLIDVIPYDRLLARPQLESGTYIFSDLERLDYSQRMLLADFWDQLEHSDGVFHLLNHPLRTLRRFQLLRTLCHQGSNHFGVYRLHEIPRPLKRPTFLRHENEHLGNLAGPFTEDDEFDQAIAFLLMGGFTPSELVAVEYCDTRSHDGLFRKYSAFRIAESIIPRHLIFSHHWMLKYPDLVEPAHCEEEWQYLKNNPHESELRRLFDVANVDYGRIDYSLKDNKIQVWEINTNPNVLMVRERYKAAHIPAQEHFANVAREAFEALQLPLKRGKSVTLNLDLSLIQHIIASNR